MHTDQHIPTLTYHIQSEQGIAARAVKGVQLAAVIMLIVQRAGSAQSSTSAMHVVHR